MNRDSKTRDLEELRARVEQLEKELDEAPSEPWVPRDFYVAHHVLAGCVLGMIAAMASLLFNIVGSLLIAPPAPVPQSPLRLINVYLTFPLGERALHIDQGLTLAIGCCLYLGTGMLLGIPFHLVLARWFDRTAFATRIAVVSVLALAIWLINYYAILAWLQPLVCGGRWIVDLVPWWVAALTHLVFGWTMVLVQRLGDYPINKSAAEGQ